MYYTINSHRTTEEVTTIQAQRTYQDVALNQDAGRNPTPIANTREKILENLVLSLAERFPSTAIVEITSITAFKNWPPKQDTDAVSGYEHL